MSFVHCILVVFFFAVGEAQIEMLGGTTLHGRDAAVMFPEAQEALFLSDTKQKFGVFHKLVRVEEVSTMGIFTIMQVVVQNTDCQVSHDVSSYNDVLKKCRAESEKQKCRIEYKYHDPLTATALCVKKVEESIIIPQRDQRANRRRTIYIDSIDDVEEQVVPQHSQMLGGTTEYTDSDADIKEQVKQAIFETDRKKTNGTYLWLEKIVIGFNMGISSRFQVLLKQTVCPIKVKRYNSYKKVYENCKGYGDLKNCTVEYKYFDPTISTVEC
ncbi:CinA-like protein [Trichinella spiralis]|uniref:CinA-like protein n=1 Tax=Trichinella spiralis TaxID=6334 RepID=A0ABR3KXU7_TRISP